ncbi:thiamine pyrophosphate-dependent dehydrogenase E1 component subunit alpha [Gordonia sp. LSe1-13]|uniref:Thiamine pyrophosphate-dependent dehydrogenase E1 component subunit alpha n=1 Tax=Gordonia sesuvii TaxID=3116777 RepID=A0ABU7MJJ9_9ACTN|nr:thiamine pyrophosphate-dependent dehydrogenase E1 component subunit alpha [Gordonia sp. LSe1-13]
MSTNRMDAGRIYRMMVRMRLVDEAFVEAWQDGLVPGEYHSAHGEEGINAGVLAHLHESDTLALDHRNTGPFVGRGIDLEPLMLEVLGSDEGIARGMAGHMHIFAPEVNAGADGIVGAGGPLAVGQAVAHTRVNPGSVAVTFHGEAAMNQGMMMEAYNMAVAWNLPVVFVCKDNKWGITTYSSDQTAGTPVQRARGFGLNVETAAGHKVGDVHRAAGKLIDRARAGKGPGFLYVTCHRPNGHLEGDPLVGLLRQPKQQLSVWVPELMGGFTNSASGTTGEKLRAMVGVGRRAGRFTRDMAVNTRKDPVRRGRSLVGAEAATTIEAQERAEVLAAITAARARVGKRIGFGVTTGGTR